MRADDKSSKKVCVGKSKFLELLKQRKVGVDDDDNLQQKSP